MTVRPEHAASEPAPAAGTYEQLNNLRFTDRRSREDDTRASSPGCAAGPPLDLADDVKRDA
jgi:hypothetical protein